MGASFTRRAVLTSAPALAVSLATAPVVAETESQIIVLFRQWHVVRDQANCENCADDEFEVLFAEMRRIYHLIQALPCLTALDLAAKYHVNTDCGGCVVAVAFEDECRALLEGIVT